MKIFQSLRAALFTLALALLFVATPSVFAQTGSISGTVTDASGAVVTDANVVATNLGTNEAHNTITTGAGTYRFPTLSAGNYSVSISKSGFKTVTFASVTLTIDQPLTLDAKFETGAISSTVEVSAAAAVPIDTEDATLSNVIEHTQMTELPLILRDPYQLVLLGPGVTQSDSGAAGVSVNGGRERNNNFMLDGTDNNDADVPGPLGGVTTQNPDSTEEFRVLTNNFAPEFGRNNGAIIDVITRSGTNDFHGNLYYFGRWNALGARDYFNHNIDPDSGLVEPQNPYVRNLYGGSIGGPIKKDKTFFFLNYQGDRFVTVLSNSAIVPTAAFKSGIFNYTNPGTGASQTINLLNNVPGDGQNATGLALDTAMQKILAFYPNPTIPSGDGATGTLFFPSESREKDEDATIKIDHRINANNSLFVRYIYNWFNDPNPFHTDTLPNGLGAIPSSQRTQGLAVGLTTTFSPTLTNEARFGFNRLNLFFGCNGIPDFDSVGNVDSEGQGGDYVLPVFASFGCGPNNSPASGNKQGTYQVSDYVTKVWGNHAIKFGGEFRNVYSNNYTDFNARQNFLFNNFSQFGIAPLNQASLNPGVDSLQLEDMVSALLGLVEQNSQTQFFTRSGARVANDELNFIQHEVAGYVQDVWKIRSNLSITYGVRYEWYGVPYERSGTISNLFQDPSGPAPFTFTPVGPGTGAQLYKDDYTNFEPRFGFAWDPFKDGRTSIRGGIGVFTDRVFGNLFENQRSNPPFQPSFAFTPTASLGFVPGAQLANQPVAPTLTPSPVVQDGSFLFPGVFEPNIKPPRLVTWNFGIQRQVNSNLTFEANYVGNHGTRILRVVDGNPPQPNLVSQLLGMGVDPSVLQNATLYDGGDFGQLPFNAVNNNAFYHAFVNQTSGHSWYDALQIQVNERLWHGLQIGGAYTYAHALDDSSDGLVPTAANGNFPVDSFNLRNEKGNSGFDTRHRGVINFVYTPNIGRGKSHLTDGYVGRALEGWEVSGIAAWQTGLPYDIFGQLDTLHTGISDRVTVVDASLLHTAPSNPNQGIPSAPVFTGFNPAAFNPEDGSIPIPWGVASPLHRNAWYGPGINNWDAVLAKDTKIGERVDFQLRFEFYNLFNRVQFAKPNYIQGSPDFMYSTAQVGQPDGTTGARQIQIGAKFRF